MPKRSWGFFIVLLLVYMPIFGYLDKLPLLEWDEARLATNTYEMLQNPGNILVTTFGNNPDLWNTKPPLLIWLQVLSMKALGVNELALRLPSALAAGFLCIFLYWLLATTIKRPWLGIISCLILVTSEGYVSTHGTRTADYDSLLTLFYHFILRLLFFIPGREKSPLCVSRFYFDGIGGVDQRYSRIIIYACTTVILIYQPKAFCQVICTFLR